LKDRIEGVIAKHKGKCDYLEVRVEDKEVTTVVIKDRDIETIAKSTDGGGCVRALYKGGWGFSSFNSLDALDEMAAKAVSQARLIGTEESKLAETPTVQDTVKADLKTDPRGIFLKEKVEILTAYNDIIFSHGAPVANSRVRYFDTGRVVTFANSEGSYIVQEMIDLGIGIAAIATKDGNMQMGYTHAGSSDNFDVVRGLEEQTKEACTRAAQLVDAPKVKGGVYPVVVDQLLGGVFTHEAFGHTSEADDMMENPQLAEQLKIGRKIGSDILNIYDTGLDKGVRGALVYDDEGVKTEKTWLIKDGVLVGHLHCRESAAKMNEKPTGNARAKDYQFPPIVRMRNTCIQNGTSKLEELFSGIKEGVYARGSIGGMGGEMFTFTAEYGNMIRNGKVEEMVRDVKLSGNLFKTLLNIDCLANDMKFEDGPGGCGKGSQFPLAVTDGAPHFRIKEATIGGD
jgi:TldD protein